MKTRVIVEDIRPALILKDLWCSGTVLIKFEANDDFEDLNPEDFQQVYIIVDDKLDERKKSCIRIGDIDLKKCHNNMIYSKGSSDPVIVDDETFENLINLKLYSKGYGFLTNDGLE